MDRSFQLQEQKDSLSRPSGLKPITSVQKDAGNPFHSTILSMQQTYGNRYVQGLVSGEKMPCPQLCDRSEPLVAAPTRPAAQFKPHSCDSCIFHPQRSVRQMVPGTPSSRPTQPIQAKLTIGQPGDKYEQEADRVAEQVMRIPEPQVQRQCTTPECEEEEKIQMQPISPIIQRQIEEEEMLQMKQVVTKGGNEIDEAIILQTKGSGQPLDKGTREFMEPRFGYDFSNVRIHTDSNANKLTSQLGAEAFTVGKDVFFGSGRYNPASTQGKRLIGHELTHVVQQKSSINSFIIQRSPDCSVAIINDCTDEELLTAICIGEAGNIRDRDGKKGVMNVVMNRVSDSSFPNTIREVVTAPGQFHGLNMGIERLNNSAYSDCCDLAREVMNNPADDPTYGALWFNQSCVKPCEQYCTTYLGDGGSPAHYFSRRATPEERENCSGERREPCCTNPRTRISGVTSTEEEEGELPPLPEVPILQLTPPRLLDEGTFHQMLDLVPPLRNPLQDMDLSQFHISSTPLTPAASVLLRQQPPGMQLPPAPQGGTSSTPSLPERIPLYSIRPVSFGIIFEEPRLQIPETLPEAERRFQSPPTELDLNRLIPALIRNFLTQTPVGQEILQGVRSLTGSSEERLNINIDVLPTPILTGEPPRFILIIQW